MIGVIGVIISLAFIIVSVYKGWHIFPVSVIGAIIVAITNSMNLWDALSVNFAEGWMFWAGTYFVLFALGALFGEVMSASGASKAISYKLIDIIGTKQAPLALLIVTLLLTYGGINSFVVVFTLYPLAVVLFKEANLPRSVMAAPIFLGVGTITQTAFPGTPSTQNLVPTQILGTTATAGPIIGVVVSVFYFIVGMIYINHVVKVARKNNEGFVPIPADNLGDGSGDDREGLPNWLLSLIPIIVVIVLIFALKNTFTALCGVSIALTAGVILTYIFMWKRVEHPVAVLNKGFSSSIMPLMNTAAIIGYGYVVQASPAFQTLVEFAMSLAFNPYVTAAIGVNILAGVSGSSSGGLQIFLNSMGQFLLDKGCDPDALHRVAAIASGGLDTLPHNGAVISIFTVLGTNHKESYKHVFVLCCAIPIVGTVIAVVMAMMGII